MPMTLVEVTGYEAFLKAIEENEKSDEPVYVLFCGSNDPNTGESWCSDCVKAEPVIALVLSEHKRKGVFIMCKVGDRTFWKDPANGFRTHPKLLLKGIPTLMVWGTPRRLVEEDCSKADLVRMVFESDEDQ